MDFKTATDILGSNVSHKELAEELEVSVPTIRQARLEPIANAYRSPPHGWEAAVARLAESRARELTRLAKRLRAQT